MQRFLFDRLCQPQVNLPVDEQGKLTWLRRDITNELQRIFSQRAFFDGLELHQSQAQPDSVLNFGLSDIASRSANFEDTHRIKEELRRAVQHYEPRLLSPQIELVPTGNPLMPACVHINGTIKSGELQDEFCWRSMNQEMLS